jgi:hypothetical protein
MLHVQLVYGVLALCAVVTGTRLDDYVWRPDPNYSWVDMGPEYVLHGSDIQGRESWTGYTINMTSQKWLTDADYNNISDVKSLWYVILVCNGSYICKQCGYLFHFNSGGTTSLWSYRTSSNGLAMLHYGTHGNNARCSYIFIKFTHAMTRRIYVNRRLFVRCLLQNWRRTFSQF